MSADRVLYSLHIDAVDGERSYSITSPDKAEVLAFADQHDHEGSCVVLVTHRYIEVTQTWYEQEWNAEEGYALLRHH